VGATLAELLADTAGDAGIEDVLDEAVGG